MAVHSHCWVPGSWHLWGGPRTLSLAHRLRAYPPNLSLSFPSGRQGPKNASPAYIRPWVPSLGLPACAGCRTQAPRIFRCRPDPWALAPGPELWGLDRAPGAQARDQGEVPAPPGISQALWGLCVRERSLPCNCPRAHLSSARVTGRTPRPRAPGPPSPHAPGWARGFLRLEPGGSSSGGSFWEPHEPGWSPHSSPTPWL